MANTIRCTHCGKEVEVTEALSHELEEKILAETESKHKAEIEKITKEISEKSREDAIKKVRAQYDAKIESTKLDAEETAKQNKKLQDELSQLMKDLRESKNAESKLKIEFEKKILAEQDRIKAEAIKEAQEELHIEILTKNKKLDDAQKQIDELKRKLQQGSQQTQGEVLEIEFESTLSKEFPDDIISEVPKGVRGADIIQFVRTKSGIDCGQIVWEIKNTKTWTKSWLTKLKQDQRILKAEIGIIVTSAMPEDIDNFGFKKGIWVTNKKSAFSLVHALRQQLLKVQQVKSASSGKQSNAEAVYDYLASNEFRQRIETLVEYFDARRAEIGKERNYFLKKWEQEETNIYKAMSGAIGVYADLQGITGSALPKINNLELPEEI